MFCPKCGGYNSDESVKCKACGYTFEEDDKKKEKGLPNLNTHVYKPISIFKDYKFASILVTIFCNIAFGITALIFSGLADVMMRTGENEKAEMYAQKAKYFCFWALGMGIFRIILFIVFITRTVYFIGQMMPMMYGF